MRNSESRGRRPSEDRIEAALDFFSPGEWRRLIGAFGGRDTGALWMHVDRNRDRLERGLGRDKLYTVFDAIGTRNVELMCKAGPWRTTAISDALWAGYWQKLARQQNIARASRPSEKRSWPEVGGPNNIAESLSRGGHEVSAYKVREMLKRLERVPYGEQFDGSCWDYLMWATDPRAFRKFQRRIGKRDH